VLPTPSKIIRPKNSAAETKIFSPFVKITFYHSFYQSYTNFLIISESKSVKTQVFLIPSYGKSKGNKDVSKFRPFAALFGKIRH